MNQPTAVNVEAFINERAMSGAQWALMFLCFLIVAADGIDVVIMGFLAPPIVQEWGISCAAFGLVIPAVLATLAGRLAARAPVATRPASMAPG